MSLRSSPGAPAARALPDRPALWLVRHGESTWNAEGLCQGHSDEAELTERGRQQAARAAAQFGYRPVHAIYSSDLRRAQQTAAAFSAVLGLEVRLDARLRERRLGVLEGTPHAAISPADLGHADGRLFNPDARPPGGESVRDLYQRAAAFCSDLVTSVRAGGPGGSSRDVLVITHGGTVRVLAACLAGIPVEEMAWPPLGNAACLYVPCPPERGNR